MAITIGNPTWKATSRFQSHLEISFDNVTVGPEAKDPAQGSSLNRTLSTIQDPVAPIRELQSSQVSKEDASTNGSVIVAPPSTTVATDYAFGFDLDGVFLRGGNVIEEAKQALRILNGDNEYHVKVPYFFLTNGQCSYLRTFQPELYTNKESILVLMVDTKKT